MYLGIIYILLVFTLYFKRRVFDMNECVAVVRIFYGFVVNELLFSRTNLSLLFTIFSHTLLGTFV